MFLSGRWQAVGLSVLGFGLLALGLAGFLLLPRILPAAEAETLAVPVEVNFLAPELTLYDLSGRPVSLADYSGQVVLLNNWATWCPPCKEEMPALQAYFEAHRSQGFMIVAIEAGDEPANIVRFVAEYGLTFAVWSDPDEQSLATFQNIALPNSYVIDRSGKVRLAWNGAIDLQTLEQYVTLLLEE